MLEALWGWPPPGLDPAGPYAAPVTTLAWVLLALGVGVTALIVAALWLAIKGPAKWKARLGGDASIVVGGVAFPAIVLTALLVWGLTLTASLSRPILGGEPRIRVTGEMWWFRVEYLDASGRVVERDANELHLPVGVPVVLELRSADVIHSFWVPRLSGKKDMVPGRTNLLRIEAREAGQFGGVCAEYCGGPHALMGLVVVAHERRDWARWVSERHPRPAEPSGETARGAELFVSAGCAACHRVAGTPAAGLAGPDLTHIATRRSLGAGILPNHRGTLIGWITDSQTLKPGNRMPNYDTLPQRDIAAIAAWLETRR